MPDDDFDAKLGEMIADEVDTEADDEDTTSAAPSPTSDASTASNTDTTRSRTQYAMYLPATQIESLNYFYKRFNAERVLEGREEAEKNRHFHESLVAVALEHDDELATEIEARIERDGG